MATESDGNAATATHGILAAGTSRPPPSTLAAQLVENISTKSSRPDENAELKKFLPIIQTFQQEPTLLQSQNPEERIEHNHMLIYFFTRFVLDPIKLDDPFASRNQLQNDALKTINFLKVTVDETPQVIGYRTTGGAEFLFRGDEPLWLWILPKILRLLGHGKCRELTPAIEAFFHSVVTAAGRYGCQWMLLSSIALYLREEIDALVSHIQDLKSGTAGQDIAIKLELPRESTIELVLERNTCRTTQLATYTVITLGHALRQASSLSSVFSHLLVSQTPDFDFSASISEHLPWYFDSLLSICAVQGSWYRTLETNHTGLIQSVLRLIPTNREGAKSLIGNKSYTVLGLLCQELAEHPEEFIGADEQSHAARKIFCVALMQLTKVAIRDRGIGRFIASKIICPLEHVCVDVPAISRGTDFWRSLQILKQVSADSIPATLDADTHPERFVDIELRRGFEKLGFTYQSIGTFEPVSKRRKVSPDSSILQRIIDRMSRILRGESADDAVSFEHCYMNAYPELSEEDQCLVIDLLSRTCCAADGTLSPNECVDDDLSGLCCSACGPKRRDATQSNTPSANAKRDALSIFTKIIALDCFLASRRPRVVAMICLRRLVFHADNPAFFDLETSQPAQWCIKSLRSSLRELRIAAGRTLPLFLRESSSRGAESEVVVRNRTNALALLNTAPENNSMTLSESGIMTWGQIGRVVMGDELNLVLHKLLQYLGNSNSLIAACAFNELLNLASARGTTPRRLLEPFWRNLAFFVVKDIVSRPQISRAVAELLQITVNELLLLVQKHSLPWLVLTKKREVVQKIAEARGERDAWLPVLDSANIGPIFAQLLAQDVPDIEQFVKSRLIDISSHFESFPLVTLVQSDTVAIVLELFKVAADGDESRKPRAIKALNTVCLMLLTANKEPKPKKGNVIGRFLQSYMLGLMARLADVINDVPLVAPPVQEQRRCIRAMEEMISVCKSYVRVARPQISACLLSALAQDDLREAAFSCWTMLLAHLDDEDVETLLETTFFVISRYWDVFNGTTCQMAKDLLSSLLSQRNKLFRENINKLPPLSHITELSEVDTQLQELRQSLDNRATFMVFSGRISHENSGVVLQALGELASYLADNQGYLQGSAVSEQPDSVVSTLLRALLDCAAKYSAVQLDIASLCAQCIGLVGCLDSNRIESVREQKSMVILSNFESQEEATDFVLFVLEQVLVKAFLSTTDTKLQGFLSYAMQELLDRVDVKAACSFNATGRTTGDSIYRKWLALPDTVREVLTPFLTSKYMLSSVNVAPAEYPIFRPGKPYGNWIRSFVFDLLGEGKNGHAVLIFPPLRRVIRVKDLSVAEFLLPYLVLHIIISDESTAEQRDYVVGELVSILQHQPAEDAPNAEWDNMKLFCEAVFRVLDYGMRWIQKKKALARLTDEDKLAVVRVQEVLDMIPAELIAQRAIDCKQYSRALFHLEQHAQQARTEKNDPSEQTRLLDKLQDIYTQIDEPDGLEGISAHLHILDINQQILSHRKAGRWTAAQTWYEIKLAEDPDNIDVQVDLLTCLKQSGQHDVLLNYVEGMHTDSATENKIIPFAVEAAWATSRWETLRKFASRFHGSPLDDFNVGISELFKHLQQGGPIAGAFTQTLQSMRGNIASAMTFSATSSLQASHDLMLRCHVLTDLEIIAGAQASEGSAHQDTLLNLNRRLEVLGAYVNDKQYLLGIRRAAMELMRPKYSNLDISSLWLSGARLARKANATHQSFNAVLHASQLGDGSAVIENARLLWKDGHQRKAIQVLQGAIKANNFMTQTNSTSSVSGLDAQQRLLTARAQLMLAKWLDAAGQTHAFALREKYQQGPKTYPSWEKGHYYLGRHYKKVMESEKVLKIDDQSDAFLQGELARLVIENYVRSLNYGTKYLYQTLPRILTLWLELGAQVDKAPNAKISLSTELHRRRTTQLGELHDFLAKYIRRLPAYIFYTALPQIVARITHPNQQVFKLLTDIVVKVVDAHPRQALWGLFGVMTTKQASERRTRGQTILLSLRNVSKKVGSGSYDLKALLRMGEKLAEQLLLACNNGDFQSNRTTIASITRDLRFNHKCTPCPLVVPIEACLTATLPTLTDKVKGHQAFSRDVITIDSFLDEVLVLGSLAKPRRLTARGSDGNNYMLLIKPKDDLRTDQRLMEFNGMINRSLKRDAESSRRQLYIRTYAVTPLNEECGIIEWVDGLKTLRDILLDQYKARGIHPDYNTIREKMSKSVVGDKNIDIFTKEVLGLFPPVLHNWFIQEFPHPSAWFSARLKYTRSCAVMSMVGTILGLGDRHGENVLLEKDNGGIFHVDFNCLFDKGLTFAAPERVPFRLTHNMVSAMGIYGYEGPFRQCSELTLSILRQQEETLMTILEAFIYDPTLDLQKKTTRRGEGGIRLQPQNVVDSIKRKVKGLLPDESIPLGVEGQVEELIKQAVEPRNLAAMYIGWCPFL